mgnify:CR=1 FL=1
MEIIPLSDAIGAEIQGVDLSNPLDTATASIIEKAWHDHIVLLFRDQDIDTDQQIAFAKHFGNCNFEWSKTDTCIVECRKYSCKIIAKSKL